jgi:hypothetical protein
MIQPPQGDWPMSSVFRRIEAQMAPLQPLQTGQQVEMRVGLKDWRRVAMRDDRCPEAFLATDALAATVISGHSERMRPASRAKDLPGYAPISGMVPAARLRYRMSITENWSDYYRSGGGMPW